MLNIDAERGVWADRDAGLVMRVGEIEKERPVF